MNKVRILLLLFVVCCFTGCGYTVSLEEKDNDAVSEYIASLLLKYDKDYEAKLLDEDELIKATVRPTVEPTVTPQATVQPTVTPDANKPEQSATQAPSVTPKQEETTYVDLNQIYSIKGVNVSYHKYGLYDKYPNSSKDTSTNLMANKGSKFLIVEMQMKNTTKKDLKVNLMDSDIEYSLVVNGKETFEPMLSILLNDLVYLNTTINADSSNTVVVAYNVPDDLKVSSVSMLVTKGDQTAKIDMK